MDKALTYLSSLCAIGSIVTLLLNPQAPLVPVLLLATSFLLSQAADTLERNKS